LDTRQLELQGKAFFKAENVSIYTENQLDIEHTRMEIYRREMKIRD
jgi:hypothetical protein